MATGVSPPAIGELGEKIKGEATDYLQAKVEELQAEGIEKVSFVAVEGRGPEEIIDLARKTAKTWWRCLLTGDPESVVGFWAVLQIVWCVTPATRCWSSDQHRRIFENSRLNIGLRSRKRDESRKDAKHAK